MNHKFEDRQMSDSALTAILPISAIESFKITLSNFYVIQLDFYSSLPNALIVIVLNSNTYLEMKSLYLISKVPLHLPLSPIKSPRQIRSGITPTQQLQQNTTINLVRSKPKNLSQSNIGWKQHIRYRDVLKRGDGRGDIGAFREEIRDG